MRAFAGLLARSLKVTTSNRCFPAKPAVMVTGASRRASDGRCRWHHSAAAFSHGLQEFCTTVRGCSRAAADLVWRVTKPSKSIYSPRLARRHVVSCHIKPAFQRQ